MWPFKKKKKGLTQDQTVFIEKTTHMVLDFMEAGFIVKDSLIKRDDCGGIKIVFSIKSRQQ